MKLSNVFDIAQKEIIEQKYRFLIISLAIPVISGIFLIPNLVQNSLFLEELIRGYSNLYHEYAPEIRRQMIIIDAQLPIYLIMPAFATPYFGLLESFIGERDARTLEGLFMLPVSRWEILAGKMMPSFGGTLVICCFSYAYHFVTLGLLVGRDLALHMTGDKWFLLLGVFIPAVVYSVCITAILISMAVRKIQTAVNISALIFAPIYMLLAATGLGYIRVGPDQVLFGSLFFLLAGVIMTLFVRLRFSVENLVLKMHD